MSEDEPPTIAHGLIPNASVRQRPTNMPAEPGATTKAGRGRLKSRVTVAVGRLKYALLDEESEIATVDELVAKLNEDHKKFTDYHAILHATLPTDAQPASDVYFAQVNSTVNAAVAQVDRWRECRQRNEVYEEDDEQPDRSAEVLQGERGSHDEETPKIEVPVMQVDEHPSITALQAKVRALEEFVSKSTKPTRVHSTPAKSGWKYTTTASATDLSAIAEEQPQTEPVSSPQDPALKLIAESISLLVKSSSASRDVPELSSVSHQSMVKLPKFKLAKFNGEPTEYWPFIQSFRQQVANHVTDPGILLGVLKDNTGEDVRALLHHCNLRDTPGEAYSRALEILEENFGGVEHVCQAWLDKFFAFQLVRTTADIRSLHTALLNCYETLRSVKQLDEFQTKGNLAVIVNKLPYKMKERWQQRSYEILEDLKRKITLDDLCKFVGRLYREKSDPNFGGDMDPKLSDQKPTAKGNPKGNRAFAVDFGDQGGLPEDIPEGGFTPRVSRQGEKVRREKGRGDGKRFKCTYCTESHLLFKCPKYVALSTVARVKFVRDNGLCMNCFNAKHIARNCPSQYRCRSCQGRHHTLLHFTEDVGAPRGVAATDRSDSAGGDVQAEQSGEGYVANVTSRSRIALPIVPVLVFGAGQPIVIYALLDQGSTCTLCTTGLVKRLGIESRPVSTTLTTVESREFRVEGWEVNLEISGLEGGDHYFLDRVLARPTLNLHAGSRAYQDDVDRWPHLRGITLPDFDIDEVELLIGQNYSGLFYPLERRGSPGAQQPFAVRTLLGWYVCGPLGSGQMANYTALTCLSDDGLSRQVERFWSVDKIPGLPEKNTEAPAMSREDKSVIELWDRTARMYEGKYMLPIPFKQIPPNLDDNREQAVSRLISEGRRLNRDPKRREQYTKAVHKNIDGERYAERVPQNELQGTKGRVRYLPHHLVFHPRKPDDPRLVYDCAAKWLGVSLNDLVRQGPDLMNRLLDVLVKFREDRAVSKGDIEGMYNQILVELEDRDSLRWVWWENDEVGGTIVTYRMKTHLFGGVWSPSCANYVIKRVVRDFGDKFPEKICRMLDERFYVDDGIDTESDVDTAVSVLEGAQELLRRGGFNFTKFLSNFVEVIARLPREKLSKLAVAVLDNMPGEIADCVLGCMWLPREDLLKFRASLPEREIVTKRTVLSDMSSLYDPLGLIMPLIINAKMIFQDACRGKGGWDGPLTQRLLARWEGWRSDIEKLAKIQFARCMLPGKIALSTEGLTFEFHLFSDASEQAYGAAAFMRVLENRHAVGVSLMAAKGKLAPLKKMTVPRLELSGAHVSVQMDLYLRDATSVEVAASYFWTDSMLVLYYVLNLAGRWTTFVGNRVSFIHENTVLEAWRHVPTKLNPADILSRGATVKELSTSHLWKYGPTYLLQDEQHWPEQPRQVEKLVDKSQVEEKKAQVVQAIVKKPSSAVRCLEEYLSHWSSWARLVKGVIYIVKYIKHRAKKKVCMKTTVDEYQATELSVVRYLQRRLEEISDARVKKQFLRTSPFVGDGDVIRVGGRLMNAKVHPHARHPILLPPCDAARALLADAHRRCGHGGARRTLVEANERFWILLGGRLAHQLTETCILCRKRRATLLTPRMKSLPEERVRGVGPPFSTAGLDFFGPILVKERRIIKKRYGCLFTCFQTRAIHLEVAWSLDISSCILAINRFADRRGNPEVLYSDNGSNLVGAKEEMRRELAKWNEKYKNTEFVQKGCTWKMNTPLASHHGGVWERNIRTVREILMVLVNEQVLTEEALATLFCRVEDVVNGRPLTPVSADPNDLAALSPNVILKPRTRVMLPMTVTDKSDKFKRLWRTVEYLADIFWERWRLEYLPLLQLRVKWFREERSLVPGDLVLLEDAVAPRNQWPMGRVKEIYPDKNGTVRSVKVKTSQGEYRRPVHKMCLLEAVT